MKRVTLADIAKKCGVSVNTVSHALNDKPDISENTKELIKNTAKKMGYIGNASASFLRSGLSKTIAVIVGDISNPHFSILIKEIEVAAREKGYTVFVLNTDENETLEYQAIVAAINKNVDGIILCPVQSSTANVEFLIKSGIPFTLMGRRFNSIKTNYVVLDDKNSGYIAAEYIINSGMKKTAVINANPSISSAEERMKGVLEYYKKYANGAVFDTFVIEDLEGEHAVVMKKIAAGGYDSAICFNDVLALELLSYLETDVKIVSFDNIRSRFKMPYNFASVTSSKTKMSHKALTILLNAISGEAELVEAVLPTRIADDVILR